MSDARYNHARLISGWPCAVKLPVAQTGSTLIKQGDLTAFVAGAAQSAIDFTWTSSLATTQENFHDAFVGSAMDQKALGDTSPILVATRGRHKYPCAALSADKSPGLFFGAAQGEGNTLDPQKVAQVATSNLAIGKLVEPALQGDTFVYLEVVGVLTTPESGAQAPT